MAHGRARWPIERLLIAPVIFSAVFLLGAAPPLTPPSPEILAEASALVQSMKDSERGPYRRIVWFCNDGTIQPPVPYACRERGGGRQHAEYSSQRERLAELGWPVGTIFAALDWDELWDPARRHVRLRQLVLERYLVGVDDGWVLRRARWYRGRVQIEDEEAAGRELLIRLLSEADWIRSDFLLARESVRVIPHHGGQDRTRVMRQLAEDTAQKDPDFQRLRIKIHTSPEAADAAAVRAWTAEARRRGADPAALATADSLVVVLDAIYSKSGRFERLRQHRKALAVSPSDRDLAARLEGLEQEALARRTVRLGELLQNVRGRVEASADGERNLRLLDLSIELESQLVADAFAETGAGALPRGELVRLAGVLVDATYGVGLLSTGERDAARDPIEALSQRKTASTSDWLQLARVLRRTGSWSHGAVRWTFAEPLVRWSALEPRAARFADDLLRGSPALPLGEVARAIVSDAELVTATPHSVFGASASGLVGLNPGVAVGRLRVAGEGDAPPVARDEIVVLPRTVSELSPVAGILTLSEGNLLSHVQILARNLGIPNALVSRGLRDQIMAADGDSVMLAVSSRGSLVLERWSALPDSLKRSLVKKSETPTAKVTAPSPDLSFRELIPLQDLHGGLSGKLVGPKAANLGDLARAFPGQVAPAIALPFGVFAEYVSEGEGSPLGVLRGKFALHRKGELNDAQLAAEVEKARAAIAAVTLTGPVREAIVAQTKRDFGDGAGLFVRSDTNVEDLPGFTGAGLNETVANVVGAEAQLAAIPRVWASPFRERPMAWRANLLTRPEDVYTSVLLMKSVPAEKSGVLVTTDLLERGGGFTVATAWGVGGAVDNESAETVVLRPDGRRLLVGEAKAAYGRRLRESGGIEWVPVAAGPVLTEEECAQLRRLVKRIGKSFRPVKGPRGEERPWDVEFGFLDGQVTLFQIRPLIERGQEAADQLVESLVGEGAPARGDVDLAEAVAWHEAGEDQ